MKHARNICPDCKVDNGPLLNPQGWKLAASGAGVIVFQPLDNCLRVLLSLRADNVGYGHGITGGGFVECKDIDKAKVGTVVQTADEAYREAREENAGFEKVIDIDSFLERAQLVSSIHARIADENRVHCANMFALRANGSEWKQFAALPPGVDESGKEERSGPLLEYFVRWGDAVVDRRNPERYVTITDTNGRILTMTDFFHPHEFHAIAAIAWHKQNGKLW
jgi:hypothetical protein